MKWEYYILDLYDLKLPIIDRKKKHNQLQEHINELGKQGWEYTEWISVGETMMFKRPIPQ